MKIRTIKIPIYFDNLSIVFTDDFKKVDKLFKTKIGNSKYDGVCFDKKDEYVIALKKIEWSIIAHEVVHIVNSIYLKCGIQLDRVNDEPQAYLTGWIINEIDKFVKESSSESKL